MDWVDELSQVASTMRAGKSIGVDSIPPEACRVAGKVYWCQLAEIVKQVIKCNRFPDVWKGGIMCGIPRKPRADLQQFSFRILKGRSIMRFWSKCLVHTFLKLICELTFLAGRRRIAENIRHVRWLPLFERRACQKAWTDLLRQMVHWGLVSGGGRCTTLSA